MEQNHVTVTLYILAVKPTGQRVLRPKQAGPKAHRFAVIGVIPFCSVHTADVDLFAVSDVNATSSRTKARTETETSLVSTF